MALCGVLASPAAHAAPRAVDLSSADGVIDLSPYTDVLRDQRGEWTAAEVGRAPLAGRFTPAGSGLVDPRGDAALWLRVRYRNAARGELQLSICHPLIEGLRVFVGEGERWIEQSLRGRGTGSPSDPLLVGLPARGQGTVLLRVSSKWPVLMLLSACTLEACRERDSRRSLWYGLFYGVMLVIGLFSLGLFLVLRDRSHLLYVGFLSAVSLYFLVENGFLSFLVPHVGVAGLFKVNGGAISLMVIFSGAFARSFLETRRVAPLIDRVALVYVWLGAGFALAMFLVPWGLLRWYANTLGLLAPVVIIGTGAVAWRRGFRPARLYLLAWSAIGVGGFVLALPSDALWQVQFFQVCAAVNALLLTLALVDRLRDLRREREEAMGAARERERLVRAVFDQTFQFIGLTGPDGTLLDVNRSALTFIGARVEDVVGRPFWETAFWPQDEAEARRLREAFERAARGEFVRFETRAERPDGGTLWLDFSLKPILDESGQVALLIPEGRDISGRVRSEQALRQTRDQLDATLSALPDLFFEVDRQGRIHDFRAPHPELLAIPPERFLGQRVDELMPPAVAESIKRALEGAEQNEGRTCVGAVYSLDTPRGPGWFEPSVAVKGELQGDQTRFVVLVRDVTDRKQVEQELRRREHMLRTLNNLGHRLFVAQRLDCAGLEELGPAAEVSRVAIYENRETEQGLTGERRYEWVGPGADRCGDVAQIAYAKEGLERWVEQLEQGEPVVGSVPKDFPPGERAVLQRLGVRALAAVPIFVAQRWWGILAFEECGRDREWSTPEVMVLRSAAGLLGVSIEREQAGAALRESEAKYRAIFENAQVALFRIDRDGRVVEANSVMAEMFGYETREDYIQSYSMTTGWLDPADQQRMFEQFGANDGVLDRFEARFKRKDGSAFWARFSARLFPEKGYMEGVGQDITEEKSWLQELAESESRYRTIFETTGHAMVIFDDDGRIQLANREFEKLTGYDLSERPLTWMELFTGKTLERMLRYHEQRAKDPGAVPRSYEATLVDRHGHEHEGHVVIDMIPGTRQRVAGFLDLTARKRAEQEMLRADKMAALGQIIAGVAHEINNPNNFIYFNLPILKRYIEAMRPMLDHHAEEDPGLKVLNMPYEVFLEDVSKLVENMQHGSERITSIVSELKNYIRGHEMEERRPEQLGTVVDHVMVLVGKQVQKMVKRFEVEVAPGLPPAMVNAGKIEQVLINLIINAGQAADKQDSWVRLEARESTGEPGWLEVVVEDNGAGIPADVIEHVFDPFFTTKGRDAGTGLGLSISHRIIEEHGGSISVESTAGEGCRFVIRLPVCQKEAEEVS